MKTNPSKLGIMLAGVLALAFLSEAVALDPRPEVQKSTERAVALYPDSGVAGTALSRAIEDERKYYERNYPPSERARARALDQEAAFRAEQLKIERDKLAETQKKPLISSGWKMSGHNRRRKRSERRRKQRHAKRGMERNRFLFKTQRQSIWRAKGGC